MPSFSLLHRYSGIWIFAALTAMVVMAIMTFTGAKDFYYIAGEWSKCSDCFEGDLYKNNTYILDISMYYWAMGLIGIDINNDITAIAVHLLLSGIGVFFLYKSISKFCRIGGDRLLAILLIVCVPYPRLLDSVYSSPFSLNNSNPSGFSHAISFIVIYSILSRKYAVAAGLCALIVLVASRGEFLLLPIMAFMILLDRQASKVNLLWLALPLAAGGLISARLPLPAESASALEQIEHILQRESGEAIMAMVPLQFWPLLVVSLLVFPFLLRGLPSGPWRNLCLSVWAATVLNVVFGFLYTWKLYQFFPSPKLMLLGAPRAVKFHTIVFIVTTAIILLRHQQIPPWRRLLLLAALVALRPDLRGLAASGILLMLAVLPIDRLSPRLLRLPGRALPLAIIALVVALIAIQVPRSYPMSNAFFANYSSSGRWSSSPILSTDDWYSCRELRSDPDFILVKLVDVAGYLVVAPIDCNGLARKSLFIHDSAHLYFSPTAWREHQFRVNLWGRFLADLNNRRSVDMETIEELARRQVRVMLPASWADMVPGHSRVIGGLVLVTIVADGNNR